VSLLVKLVGIGVALAAVWYVVSLRGEVARLEDELAGAPAAAPAAPAAVAGGRTLAAAERAALIERLGGAGMSVPHPVWFATVANDPEAAAFQGTLASAFEEAGWQVQGNARLEFAVKAGVFILAADEEPPAHVDDASAALEAAGITITASGRGYRAFYEERKQADPGWVGVELPAAASYVIVVGRRPPPDDAPAS